MKKRTHNIRLRVRAADEDDVYEDIVRVSRQDRGDLETGAVHKFSTTKGHAYFVLRGTTEHGKILMDRASRRKLNLEPSEECVFTTREVGFWGEFRWVWAATNPIYRVPGRLGVLSLVLGILAVIPLAWGIVAEVLLWLCP